MVNRFRIRDVKRKMRRDLHSVLLVPALYLRTLNSTPVPCTVRVWAKWGAIGQQPGKEGWAEIQEITPKIIFFVEQVAKPHPQAIVSIEPGEAYRVNNALVPDDLTITAEVTRLDPKNATDKAILDALPLPVDMAIPSSP